MLTVDEQKDQSRVGFFPPGSPLRLGSSLAFKGRRPAGPRCAVRATGSPGGGLRVSEDRPLCADRPEGRPAPQRGGVGRTSWRRGLVPGRLPCSPARLGGPTRGTGPPPTQEGPEEPEPRRPSPSARRPPGTRDAPSARPRARRARPACSQSSQAVAGSSARLAVRTFRADAGRHRAPSSRSRVVVCVCSGERGPAVPTASRLGREGAGPGSRGAGRPHLRRELWTPGRRPPAKPPASRGSGRPAPAPAPALRAPRAPPAARGRPWATRSPSAPRPSPSAQAGEGSLRKGPSESPRRRRTEGPPAQLLVLTPRKLSSVLAGRVRPAGPLEGPA
ncbi:serine/arginine repetitive matrix protein 3-like [Muntiacus reevesi]|uniref:serine/arginine repetitive matrix protein 3-like n=1 Tax=Muntiacus reevesi TaxID=9886 RepID=UPI003306DEDD